MTFVSIFDDAKVGRFCTSKKADSDNDALFFIAYQYKQRNCVHLMVYFAKKGIYSERSLKNLICRFMLHNSKKRKQRIK
jgi:hypothetical protein